MAFLDIVGNFTGFFQLGIKGNRLKNLTGGVAVRNANDDTDAQLTTSQLNNSGDKIVLNSAASGSGTNWLYNLLRPATGMSQNLSFILPATPPTAGQVLSAVDSSGTTTWSTVASIADRVESNVETLLFNATSPQTLFVLPKNSVVHRTTVYVDTVFNGTPTLSIGTTGSPSLLMASNQVDLTDTAGAKSYITNPVGTAVSVDTPLIATYSAGGATAGAGRILVEYSIPS